MYSVVAENSFFQSLGKHASVHEVKNPDAADGSQHQGEVVQHLVLGSSPLMNSESIVDLECLLLLLDFKVAGVDLTLSCRGGDLSASINEGTGPNKGR